MRRAVGLLSSTLALMLVLVLPGTALGASYTYTVISNTCYATGGEHGYGHVYFEVKLKEYSTSANKFTFTASAQERNIGATRWRTDLNFGTFTWKFNASKANNWYARWYDYDPEDFAWHRIKVTLKVWHGTILLAKKTIHGDDC